MILFKKQMFLPFMAMVVCAQSASLQAQTCEPNIQESTPTSKFKDISDGTVIDLRTGLMWKKCTEGLSGLTCTTGDGAYYIFWDEALRKAAGSKFAGYTDWRLPNIKELASLIEFKCNPSINLAVFPNAVGGAVWSSTGKHMALEARWAWVLSYGCVSTSCSPLFSALKSTQRQHVRLVRDAQ